ncbi:NADPH:quinone reductase [Klebsiella pneumoniae subsp. pneumoniae]|nr:NADPH:quinone reductase [Klebsiella pneumoniae subsp. pneumoniae]
MATRIEFSKHGGPEVLQAVEFTPRDPAEHEIQVENKAIGINYIDTYASQRPLSAAVAAERPGHRGGRHRQQVGHGVTHIKVGDRVVYAQSALGAYSTVHNVLADKAAVLPDAISFEQAAASFLKGLTVWYLLRKTYEIKPDEMFLFHAAAGGVGLIACQWAKALGAKLIGTVGSAQKAQRAKEAGAWQVINYREESIVERLKALTDGKKVAVVYDSVGKDTWEALWTACSAAA